MKTEVPEISVIIPIYNSEDTIAACIESVVGQRFTNFELILVDDGSKDESGRICDRYALNDKRITVIHQENKGRTAARAAGVAKARGKWINFVDSDDMLPPSSLSDLYKKADEETDIVLGNGFLFAGETRESIPIDDFRHLAVRGEGPIGVPWGSLYRRSVVTPYAFDLPRDIMNGEDYIYWLRVVFQTEKSVHVVYGKVYDKGEDHTSNCFVWTADYSYKLNEFRQSSIPSDMQGMYMRDMIADRLVNLFSVASCTPRKEWIKSPFYMELLRDMKASGMTFSLKQKVYLHLPGRMWRKGYSRLSDILGNLWIR